MARVPISTGSIPRPTLKTLLIVYGGAALTEDRITTDLLGENGGGAERELHKRLPNPLRRKKP